MDLVEFLRARLDEDERAAQTMATHYPSPWDLSDRGWMARVMADEPNFREVVRLEQWAGMPTGGDTPWLGDIIQHVARHDPARVLAEVEAKRRIIDYTDRWGENDDLLRLLALPYAAHPDFQPEWKP